MEAEHGEERAFRAFEDLTLVPYCRKLIEPELLTQGEREAVNAYHARVREAISPLLPRGAADWLERETEAL